MESDAAPEQTPEATEADRATPWKDWGFGLAVGIGLAGFLLYVYGPALRGPLLSDDFGYLTSPYTESLDATSLARMFDPTGDARLYTGNYAPIHLLLHAIERAQFGHNWLGYHVVNVGVHALNSLLLALLLMRSGASKNAALLGGLVFAVHPANVEAVAWISQLKSTGALAFSLLGLLYFDRRPALGAVCFGLALLTKLSAAFALPTVAALVWVRSTGADRKQWRWVAVWCVTLALYALPQFAAFAHIGSAQVDAFADPLTHLRTVAAIGARYLVMAASSFGVSAFAEPQPVESWLDGYWLAALVAGPALAWRTFWGLSRRREEAVWWIAAAAAFGPVSQIFPFLIPVADRYLYFILPGLIGGSILFGDAMLQHLAARWEIETGSTAGGAARSAGMKPAIAFKRGLMLVVAGVAVMFAITSHERAALWQNETRLLVDAALHYPDGGTAHYLRAQNAARQGRIGDAVASLRRAAERGMDRYQTFERDPAFAAMRSTPTFRLLILELAGRWIERAQIGPDSTQPELLAVAQAYRARGEFCEAQQMLDRALATEGPLRENVEAEKASLLQKSPDACAIESQEARHRREDS